MLRKLWQQEQELASHISSTVRKQTEMEAGAQDIFFLSSLGPQPKEWGLLYLGCVFPPQLT